VRLLQVGDVFEFKRRVVLDGTDGDYVIPAGKYVVVNAGDESGGHGHGAGDMYASAYKVRVSKLKNDEYDPDAEIRWFYHGDDPGRYQVYGKEVEVIGKMRRIVTFEWVEENKGECDAV